MQNPRVIFRRLRSQHNREWFKRAADVSSNVLRTWTIMLNNFVIVFCLYDCFYVRYAFNVHYLKSLWICIMFTLFYGIKAPNCLSQTLVSSQAEIGLNYCFLHMEGKDVSGLFTFINQFFVYYVCVLSCITLLYMNSEINGVNCNTCLSVARL